MANTITPAVGDILRSSLKEYYGIPSGEGAVTFHYINTGFTKLEETGGAEVDTTAYIGDRNSTSAVSGYSNSFNFESRYKAGEPVCDDLYEIATKQKIGNECVRELISINLAKVASAGGYEARKFSIAVQANPPSGEPKKVTTLTGTFHQNGDIVYGTFDPATLAFTPAKA